MSSSATAISLLAPFLGSLSQEVLHWYGLRHKLDQESYTALLRSKAYWTIIVVMTLFSGFLSHLWFSGANEVDAKTLFIFGAGIPALLKQVGGAAQSASANVQLGPSDVLHKYFA